MQKLGQTFGTMALQQTPSAQPQLDQPQITEAIAPSIPQLHQQITTIAKSLESIAMLLPALAPVSSNDGDGFVDSLPGTRVYIAAGQVPGFLWYRRVNEENIGIPNTILNGRIVGLEYRGETRKVQGKDKQVWKTYLSIKTNDGPVELVCGYGTHTSNSMAAAIANADPNRLQNPIYISVRQADQAESVVWISIHYSNGEPIKGIQYSDMDQQQQQKMCQTALNVVAQLFI